jgi:dihydropyrimidine dehydrogenase (NADP+)
MSIAQMMKAEFPGSDFSLSGVGGVETGNDAAEFILLGANTVQVMLQLHQCHNGVFFLCKDLQAFMSKHGFTSIEDFRGYISYSHLVVII